MDIRLFNARIDQDKLNAFNARIFGSQTDQKTAEQTFLNNPYANGDQITVIAVHEDAIVGHLTSTPFSLWVQGKEYLAYWISGFHVSSETRGKGVGKKLVACLNEALPLSSAVVVVEPSLRAFKSNGWVWPGLVAEYVHIANPKTFLSTITIDRIERFLPNHTKAPVGAMLKLTRSPIAWGILLVKFFFGVQQKIRNGAALNVEQVEAFGPEVDTLWEKTSTHYALTHVRNAQNINWQFPTKRGWKKFVYRSASKKELKAWGLYAVKQYTDGGPLDGLRALNIIDLFWDVSEPGVLAEVINYVLYLGYSEAVDLIMVSGNLSELGLRLNRSAFVKIPSTVYVGFSEQQIGGSAVDLLYKQSYITRGYADAAGGMGP